MDEELTDRQAEILGLFVDAAGAFESAPTYREIGDALDINSTNGVNDHIKALISKGWLERGQRNTSRSIGLTTRAKLHFFGRLRVSRSA